MEIEGSPVGLAKRIVELEVQCDQLEHEKVNLREQVIDVTIKEEKMKDKCMKAKRKYGALKDKFDLEERKWNDANAMIREKSRQVEAQKRKLEIDLKAAAVGNGKSSDETVVKLRAIEAEVEPFKILLQERDGRITNLLAKIKVLERQNEDLERQNGRLEMDFKAKMAEDAKKQKLGEQKNLELNQKIQVMQREKEQIVIEVSKLKRENSDEAKKSLNLNKGLEVERKRLEEVAGRMFEQSELIKKILNEKRACEEDSKEAVALLFMRIEALEKEKREMAANFSQDNTDNNAKIQSILKEKIAAEAEKRQFEEESKNKVMELTKWIEALMEEKWEMEAEVSRANMRILNEKVAKEADKRAFEEENKKMIVELRSRIESLEEEERETKARASQAHMEKNAAFKKILNEKKDLEEESKKTVSMLSMRVDALEEEKREIESKYSQAKADKNAEIQRILDEKINVEAEKRAFEEESKKRIESLEEEKRVMEATVSQANVEKNVALERISSEKMAAKVAKKALEEDSKKLVSIRTMEFDALEEGKRETESKYSQSITEKNEEIRRILKEKMIAEDEKRASEEESKKLITELSCRVESLVKEKRDMEAKAFQENTEKIATLRSILSDKKVLEEESKKMVLKLNSRIEALEEEKREMESEYKEIQRDLNIKIIAEAEKRAFEEVESKKMLVELTDRVEALEVDKKEMEAKVSQANMEMNEEIERISKGKIVAEAERRAFEESSKKKVGVLLKRIEALLEEKREREAKILKKNAEIGILKEKMALKEKGEKMSSKRDEVIQVLRQENETLEAQKNKLKVKTNRLVLKIEEVEDSSGILGVSAAAETRGNLLNEAGKRMTKKRIEVIKQDEEKELPTVTPPQPSQYESQKRRDWSTFQLYMWNHEPWLRLESWSGAHVIKFLKHLDQFGETKVHISTCPYLGKPKPPATCTCPLRQAWLSMGCVVGRLRAAFEENGGCPESNPFAAQSVTDYLRVLREAQAMARDHQHVLFDCLI